MLTKRQKTLVQKTFKQVAPVCLGVADLFYDRLFMLDPSLRPLFTDNMLTQRRKLAQTITEAVESLNHLDRVVSSVEVLGRRHIGYGVLTEHYDTAEDAFLWTLERCLGPSFTFEVHQAWVATYALLASAVQQAPEVAAA